jgi:hypothetical protein
MISLLVRLFEQSTSIGTLRPHLDATSRIPFVYGNDQISSDKIPRVEEIGSLRL